MCQSYFLKTVRKVTQNSNQNLIGNSTEIKKHFAEKFALLKSPYLLVFAYFITIRLQ